MQKQIALVISSSRAKLTESVEKLNITLVEETAQGIKIEGTAEDISALKARGFAVLEQINEA